MPRRRRRGRLAADGEGGSEEMEQQQMKWRENGRRGAAARVFGGHCAAQRACLTKRAVIPASSQAAASQCPHSARRLAAEPDRGKIPQACGEAPVQPARGTARSATRRLTSGAHRQPQRQQHTRCPSWNALLSSPLLACGARKRLLVHANLSGRPRSSLCSQALVRPRDQQIFTL